MLACTRSGRLVNPASHHDPETSLPSEVENAEEYLHTLIVAAWTECTVAPQPDLLETLETAEPGPVSPRRASSRGWRLPFDRRRRGCSSLGGRRWRSARDRETLHVPGQGWCGVHLGSIRPRVCELPSRECPNRVQLSLVRWPDDFGPEVCALPAFGARQRCSLRRALTPSTGCQRTEARSFRGPESLRAGRPSCCWAGRQASAARRERAAGCRDASSLRTTPVKGW